MTVPAAPLLGWGQLVRALRGTAGATRPWAAAHGDRVTAVYQRGNVALAAGVTAFAGSHGVARVHVWAPGYICEQALSPLRADGFPLHFFRVRPDLSPDWASLAADIAAHPGPGVLVLVHYFGFPNRTAEAAAFCEAHGLGLLEDAAHLAVPIAAPHGGIIVYSPRKTLPVPAGGLVVVSPALAPHLPGTNARTPLPPTLRWVGRKLAQRALAAARIPWHRALRAADDAEGVSPAASAWPPGYVPRCNALELRMLRGTVSLIHRAAKARMANYAALAGAVAGIPGVRLLFADVPEGACPYALPVLVSGGGAGVARRLRRSGVLASRWPDLPPEVLAQPAAHRQAIELHHELLLLPVHQSLTRGQRDFIAHGLRRAVAAQAA